MTLSCQFGVKHAAIREVFACCVCTYVLEFLTHEDLAQIDEKFVKEFLDNMMIIVERRNKQLS